MFFVGADPEVFVGDTSGVRSIIGRIGGSKDCPLPMPIGDGFAVQEDNVALEFNIPASNTRKLFVDNITTAREFLATVMQDMHGLQLVNSSAVSFPEEELQNPAALVFGCDPDFNAYTGMPNPRPKAKDKNLRSCGGHVHIGVVSTKYDVIDPREIIKYMDLYAGIPSVMMDEGLLRKELYGKAGAYRIKPYGVEYRSLSNFWIFQEKLIAWVYDQVGRALDAGLNKMPIDAKDSKLIRATINHNVKETAEYLIKKYDLSVV